MRENGDLLHNLKVGIMGCGHLGQAIAQSLVQQGFNKENLFISYGGNPLTYQKLEAMGLSSCLTINQKLFQEAEIVFITIKPQDILALAETELSDQVLVVSCMAGVSRALLHRILGAQVYRMMFSGPDTLAAGTGIAAMYPEHERLKQLLHSVNLTHIKIMAENDLDIFTVGVCMPAAILKVENPIEQEKAIDRIGKEYPLLSALYPWALQVLPYFQDYTAKEAYIERMITKGGITEAMIKSLLGGEGLDGALRKGIARTKEISFEIQQSMIH